MIAPNPFSAPLAFGAGLFITGAILAFFHYFTLTRPPEKREDGTRGDSPHRLVSYAVGLLAIYIGAAVWLFGSNAGVLWVMFFAFGVVGGLVTLVCWGLDWVFNHVQRDRARRHDVAG